MLFLFVFSLACANGANLVTNGSFEADTTVGQVAVHATITPWTVGAPQNGFQTHAFVFIVNGNADSSGFPSENSPPNIKLWGPSNGVNNGFTISPDGGAMLGLSGDYAKGTVSQTISGLTVGNTYDLKFDWAGSQMEGFSGATTQKLSITFGSDTVETVSQPVPSKGFTGWLSASFTFTATSTTQTLSFTASGSPTGLAPFLLLDGVSLAGSAPPPPPSPTIVSLTPSSGDAAGGFDVVIAGTDFPATPTVKFGTVVATVKASPAPTSTSITVTAPPCGVACNGQSSTIVDVTVTDGGAGKRSLVVRAPNSFTYVSVASTE